MNARSKLVRVVRLALKVLRVLLIVGLAVGAAWATWSIHSPEHPWPAIVLAMVAAIGAAKLGYDLTRRSWNSSS